MDKQAAARTNRDLLLFLATFDFLRMWKDL
jgi:hypothetical protein